MIEDNHNLPEDGFTAVPPSPTDPEPPDVPRPAAPIEIMPPTPVSLRTEGASGSGRARTIMAALTEDALWLQDTWQLRQVVLSRVAGIEALRGGKELVLALRSDAGAEAVRLTFANAEQGRRWHDELQACRQLATELPPTDRHIPEGVALLRGDAGAARVDVGRVEFTGRTSRLADRGLQLRAALRGADAVLWVWRQKCPDTGEGTCYVSGKAVRVEDAAERQQLRQRWFAGEVRLIARRMLLLLVCQVALLLLVGVFCAGRSPFHEATGETPLQALQTSALGLGMVDAWPLILVLLLWALPRPQLLPAVGLAVLAATTLRGLTAWVAHLLGVRSAGAALTGMAGCVLVDPFDWALILIGLALSVRAWRLAGEARQVLPRPAGGADSFAGKAWARGLLALTAVYALALGGVVGVSRYETSAYLAQPGIDPRREQEASLAFNQGLASMDKGDHAAAERSFQKALTLWEELTKGPSVPPAYRANLGRTLYNLAWLRHRSGRVNEADSYYLRVVAIGDQLAGQAASDEAFMECLAEARRQVAQMKEEELIKALEEKDQLGVRKYEEAQVKAQQRADGADQLCSEAIALWEEILPQANAEEYRRRATARLAAAYLLLGELRQDQGKRREAEAALLKSIDYGEKAVDLAKDRPLPRHNLEVARQMLDDQHEQDLMEEIGRLCTAERYADAAEKWSQRIEEQEALLRAGKDRDAVVRRLAGRLDRFAWFLAHCPDGRVRDPKEAVKRARRATELQPAEADHWYTLATVQYRNREWRDSLASLEQVKVRAGEFSASDWLLTAMNRHQLKQRDEARKALQKAVEWIDERKRQAEGNPVLRFHFETMRPALESLRREAEKLLQGNDPADRGVG
jgi:tetratricopeptide (TPR) repeat protein